MKKKTQRWFCLGLVLISSCLACSKFDPRGVWGGVVKQTNYGEYEVHMTINRMEVGKTAGKIDYPTLKCGGTLTFTEQRDDRYVFIESIEKGRGRCTDGGTIEIRKTEATTIFWEYYTPNGNRNVFGTLARIN